MHFLLNTFPTRWVETTAARHVQILPTAAVAPQHEINNSPLTLLGGLQEDSTGAVAEEYTRGSILKIDNGCHHVRADHEDLLICARDDELSTRGNRVDETRTGARQIEAPRVFRADLRLDEAGA